MTVSELINAVAEETGYKGELEADGSDDAENAYRKYRRIGGQSRGI